MRARRGGQHPDLALCSGPGRLTEALGVGLQHNDLPLDRDPFRLLEPELGARPEVVTGPRVGITKAVDLPWRFMAAGSAFVSKPRPS
jgi:DNA-3-methyladenine glycosylase